MENLFDVSHLTIAFPEERHLNTVVNDISFTMEPGEILGVVGESGSGKSMTALAAMGLLSSEAQILGGNIYFDGKDILKLNKNRRSEIQGKDISMIFQEPMTSLNPVMKIGRQVGEALLLHTNLDKESIYNKAIEALRDVGLRDAEGIYDKYPHELSGGMRQRIMIAQAMICAPKLLIADEPTTALDVVVQDQILKLLTKLHEKQKVAILFISHDLNVIKEICHRVIVMYQGVIVEQGRVNDVLEHPKHDYTKTLVASIPSNRTSVTTDEKMLQLKHLDVFYQESSKSFIKKRVRKRVIRDLSLDVYDGELMGIVGESGCGKSTLAKTIAGLNKNFSGEMILAPGVRPQMIFQDPFGSLNPSRRIGWILSEPLRVTGIKDKKDRKKKVIDLLEDIGLDASYYDRYPDELSGGQRQRISIGMALLMNARLLIADEPVSALDVTVQSQILKLLLEIHKKRNMTILFISHDLNIVRHICHRVAVIYLGEIVEMADVSEIYNHPIHPYTQMLFTSVLSEDIKEHWNAPDKASYIPDIEDDELPAGNIGCGFYLRCPYSTTKCRQQPPKLEDICLGGERTHHVRCWNRTKRDTP